MLLKGDVIKDITSSYLLSFLKGNLYPLFFLGKLETAKVKLGTVYLVEFTSKSAQFQNP